MLPQLYLHELHLYMLKKYATEFYMEYDERGPICIIYYALWLIIPPQQQNTT